MYELWWHQLYTTSASSAPFTGKKWVGSTAGWKESPPLFLISQGYCRIFTVEHQLFALKKDNYSCMINLNATGNFLSNKISKRFSCFWKKEKKSNIWALFRDNIDLSRLNIWTQIFGHTFCAQFLDTIFM